MSDQFSNMSFQVRKIIYSSEWACSQAIIFNIISRTQMPSVNPVKVALREDKHFISIGSINYSRTVVSLMALWNY